MKRLSNTYNLFDSETRVRDHVSLTGVLHSTTIRSTKQKTTSYCQLTHMSCLCFDSIQKLRPFPLRSSLLFLRLPAVRGEERTLQL